MYRHHHRHRKHRIRFWYILAVAHVLFFLIFCETLAFLSPSHFPSVFTTLATTFFGSHPQQKQWHGLCEEYGAQTVFAFYQHVSNNPDLQRYYHDFDWSNARMIRAKVGFFAHVGYMPISGLSINGAVPWSSRPVYLREGELFITDRAHVWDESSGWLIRSWCCNPVAVINAPKQIYDTDEPPSLYLPPPIVDTTTTTTTLLRKPDFVLRQPPQPIYPPVLSIATFENPPHVIYRREPPQDTCVFHPETPIPACLPATVPEQERIVCGKNGKPMRIPVCEDIPPSTLTPERTAILTPEPSTWALFGTGIILAILFHRKIKRG